MTVTFLIVWGAICLARALDRDDSGLENHANRAHNTGVFDSDSDIDDEDRDEDSTDDMRESE